MVAAGRCETLRPCRSTRWSRSGTPTCSPAIRSASPGYDERRRALASRRGRCAPAGPSTTRSSRAASRCSAARWARLRASGSCGPTTGPATLGLPMVVVTRTGGARMQEGMVALIQLARTASAAQPPRRRRPAVARRATARRRPAACSPPTARWCDLRAAYEQRRDRLRRPRGWPRARSAITLPAGVAHRGGRATTHGLVDALLAPGRRRPTGSTSPWAASTARCRPARCRPGRDARAPSGALGRGAAGPGRPAGPTGIDRAARLCDVVDRAAGRRPGRPRRPGHGGRPARRRGGHRPLPRRRPPDARPASAWPSGRSPWPAAWACRSSRWSTRRAPTRRRSPRTTASPARSPARSQAMAACPTPSVSVCVGEGGSGGALALGYADRLLIPEHAIFSVIAPEGAAAILERDVTRRPRWPTLLRLSVAGPPATRHRRRGHRRGPGRPRRGGGRAPWPRRHRATGRPASMRPPPAGSAREAPGGAPARG